MIGVVVAVHDEEACLAALKIAATCDTLAGEAVCIVIVLEYAMRAHFARTYTDADADDHRHIHGANQGVCAQAYRRAGGFAPLACSEDVALIAALQETGALSG